MGTFTIGAQWVLILVFLVLFLWRASGAKSGNFILLLIAFVFFALFFATDPGQAMLNGLEKLLKAMSGGEVADPAPVSGI